MSVIVKKLTGNKSERYDNVPYKNIYILNDGNTGWVKINETIILDVEKIDKMEDLKIRRLEWAIDGSGDTFIILSHEKLSSEYITRLMLSRLYNELQKKQSKKKVVYVNADNSTVVAPGQHKVVTIQPPAGKIWRLKFWRIHIPPIQTASSGTHKLRIGMSGVYPDMIADVTSNYNNSITTLRYYVPYGDHISPTTNELFAKALSSVVISNTYPLQLTYSNYTNGTSTEFREFKFIFEEEDEAT